jgi:hypothetical protein
MLGSDRMVVTAGTVNVQTRASPERMSTWAISKVCLQTHCINFDFMGKQ